MKMKYENIQRMQKFRYVGEILTKNNNKIAAIGERARKIKLCSDCTRKHINLYPIKPNSDIMVW